MDGIGVAAAETERRVVVGGTGREVVGGWNWKDTGVGAIEKGP